MFSIGRSIAYGTFVCLYRIDHGEELKNSARVRLAFKCKHFLGRKHLQNYCRQRH